MKTSEAIKIIKGLIRTAELSYNSNPLSKEGEHTATKAMTLAISALEKQEKDRWIPATERLPEKDCQCRVTEGDFKSVIDCHWTIRKKQFEVWSDYYDDYVTITNVTAWKPKEEPYTEEEE